jgi:threonine synthase
VDTAADGGLFVPFQMPRISLQSLRNMPQVDMIAYILGLFFRVELTGEDITRCIGTPGFTLSNADRKVSVAQLWNKANTSLEKVEYAIYRKLCQDVTPCDHTTAWPKIAIRIAILTALTVELTDKEALDIAVNAGDFTDPIAAWYCRRMGLPVGKIVCTTNENGGLWELLTYGQASCGASVRKTALPELDVALPHQLERLLFGLYGLNEAKRFSECAEQGSLYKTRVPEQLSDGFAVSVVSCQRVDSVIHKVYSTNGYILDTYSALTFGGLQDYRATSGEIRPTLILSAYSPIVHKDAVAEALGVPAFKLSSLF